MGRRLVSKANSRAQKAPTLPSPSHASTCRYKLRAMGWFRSVMKKSPRFSSFFRCSSTVNTGDDKVGGASSPAPHTLGLTRLLIPPPPGPHPHPAHPGQCPHSRWPCSVLVCSSSSLGEGVPAPLSVAHTPAAVRWVGQKAKRGTCLRAWTTHPGVSGGGNTITP